MNANHARLIITGKNKKSCYKFLESMKLRSKVDLNHLKTASEWTGAGRYSLEFRLCERDNVLDHIQTLASKTPRDSVPPQTYYVFDYVDAHEEA